MFESYKDIFNQRGIAYHQGMLKYPMARKEEFQTIIQLADLFDGSLLLDIPSGGCYLNNFIKQKVKLISIETSPEFIRNSQSSANNNILLCEDIFNIPLLDNSADRIISLAGLHHIHPKLSFYQEAYRILKPGGLFCLADAFQGSKVAQFLNIFVDRYNSMGHQGIFLNNQTLSELKSADFQILYHSPIKYYWQFNSPQEMAEYCQLLFGIDLTDSYQVLEGIRTYLGYTIKHNKCYMNWELYFIKSRSYALTN